MDQEAYRSNGGRQKIATTLVGLVAYLLAAGCAAGQTGKLAAEKQAGVEKHHF